MKKTSPKATLRQHGKSFYWASVFLGAKRALWAARLYAFCRAADDLADQSPTGKDIITTLRLWQQHIHLGKSDIPIVQDIIKLAHEIKLDTNILENLLQGLISDLTFTRMPNQNQLLEYSYLVAGTVGLMMCGLLGAKEAEAKKFAIDLGIAMQLTNILRDVAEDARAGRQYIPQDWLSEEINFFEPTAATSDSAQPAFQRLHTLAEVYYKSAYAGMVYLPWRSRLSIMIAARLYQEIGLQAKREEFPVLKKRIMISVPRKCWLVILTLLQFSGTLFGKKKFPVHTTVLHEALIAWQDTLRTVHETAVG